MGRWKAYKHVHKQHHNTKCSEGMHTAGMDTK